MASCGWKRYAAGKAAGAAAAARAADAAGTRPTVLDALVAAAAGTYIAANCCSGVTSSMIHRPRPMVLMTRSLRCTLMSVTGVAGRFCCSGCHAAPSLNDTKALNSVPAYSSPCRRGSSRTTRVG
jgi:hypothetical protein